jgi:hypothetical protein
VESAPTPKEETMSPVDDLFGDEPVTALRDAGSRDEPLVMRPPRYDDVDM